MKIKDFIDISNIKEDYKNLAWPLKLNILRKAGISALILILLIIYVIFDFSVLNLAASIFIFVGYWIFVGYTFTKFKNGAFSTVVGSCIQVNKKLNKVLRISNPGKSTAILLCKDNKVEIPIAYNQRIYNGTLIRVYFSESDLYETAPQCYKIVNPIAIEILDTTNEDIEKMKSS